MTQFQRSFYQPTYGEMPQQNLEEGKKEGHGYNNSSCPWIPKGSYTRMSRLLFTILRLALITQIAFADDFYTIASVTSCLVLWDFLECMDPSCGNIHSVIPITSILIEVVILLGVIVLLCLESLSLATSRIYMENRRQGLMIVIIVLWLPVLVLSCMLVYYLTTNYIHVKHNRKHRPAIVFTQSGEPTVVVPRSRYSHGSTYRFSVDSLVQVTEEVEL
ncbi:hypothetical protein F4821DRAFT_233008 [Hypoxylon rubiginosum]|uniref:Uncharacterized protein n=1 Tax=Hypoxylon rubiginosum TaxID=110542 RepID=A0ACC0D8V9_9PEZI|nr:hypothetical protein F4821DRAFT_233008 [Hypoxylon rubiginosum]